MFRHIFVFGSNLAGRHGAGSARYALQHHGAVYGQGIGLQGNSYAIPTKDQNLEVLPLDSIKAYADDFIRFAEEHPDWRFTLVAVGCGLAGYSPVEMAPLFRRAPANVDQPLAYLKALAW